MPLTAITHFHEDIGRASALVAHAKTLAFGTTRAKALRDDVARSAWMFTVGAMDAYFCDAYVSLLSSTLMAKSLQASIQLPKWVASIKIPIGCVLAPYATRPNWRWRMSIRGLMERDNVLALIKVQQLFNHFFRDGHKFFGDLLDDWMRLPTATSRLFDMSRSDYRALTLAKDKKEARKKADKCLSKRIGELIQRRWPAIENLIRAL